MVVNLSALSNTGTFYDLGSNLGDDFRVSNHLNTMEVTHYLINSLFRK